MPSQANKIDAELHETLADGFDSADPSMGFDRLSHVRPCQPRLPADDPDVPLARFATPRMSWLNQSKAVPLEDLASHEPKLGRKDDGTANNHRLEPKPHKAHKRNKAKAPPEDTADDYVVCSDSMDAASEGTHDLEYVRSPYGRSEYEEEDEGLRILKAAAKPQSTVLHAAPSPKSPFRASPSRSPRSPFHSSAADTDGIRLQASDTFRKLLESLLQQHVNELNDIAGGISGGSYLPKQVSNPTSPNSVFSRMTKDMDRCRSNEVDSILASSGFRLFQARNILDALESEDKEVQQLFEKKPQATRRLSKNGSDLWLPELFEDSESRQVSYRSLSWCQRARVWFQSASYEMVIALVLCINVLWMAFELQLYGQQSGGQLGIYDAPTLDSDFWVTFFLVGDFTFAGFFTLDVVLRILILRADFWRVFLNYIDLAVSCTSVAEVAVVYVSAGLPLNPILFRLLRIGKLVRAFRMVTMSSVLNSLQLLIKCLVASRDMLLWSFCLLTFVQCVAGLVLATLCRDFIENDANDDDVRAEVFRYYGTFSRTILSMFEIMFANWGPPCRIVVENVSEWFSIFFLSYRCVLGFAVLNVVNAVFVQQTMKTASSDEELAFRQKEKDIALYNRKVKKLFKTIDSSGDGAINLEEFSKLVKSPKLQFWMSQLELEYHDLLSLFEFLDNGDGQITLNEFLEGAQRLRGGAKAIDVWRMETKVEVLFEAVFNVLKSSNPHAAAALEGRGLVRHDVESDPISAGTSSFRPSGGSETGVTENFARVSTTNVHEVFNQSDFRHIKPTSYFQLDVSNLP